MVLRRDVDNWGFNMLTVMMKPTPNGERDIINCDLRIYMSPLAKELSGHMILHHCYWLHLKDQFCC